MRLLILFIIFKTITIVVNGQTPYSCLSAEINTNKYFVFGPKGMQAEIDYQNYIKHNRGLRDNSLLEIPVVIHVVSPEGIVSGLDRERIEAFLSDINLMLDGESICDGDDESISIDISLCLAQRTIDNTESDGIYYYEDEKSDLDACTEDLALKALPGDNGIAVPPTDYLNIYIVDRICATCQSIGCTVGGYASYAPAHGDISDGIVIEKSIVEGSDCHQQKVFLHELGHYLNLLHTFEGGCKNDDCLSDGDRVCDTPPSQVAQIAGIHPCTTGEEVNSCDTDVNPGDENNPFTEDQEDLLENYMSYSRVSCMRSFTSGQRLRMRSALMGPRSSLLSSKGCLEPCTEPVNWSIDIPDNIYAGESTTILNESNAAYNYTWEVEGIKYDMHDLEIMFDTSGFYSIVIYPNDANLECSDTIQVDVEVSCNVPDISFTIEIEDYEVGEEVRLAIPMADDQYTYIWNINGGEIGTGQEMLYTIPDEGLYSIYVKTCNSYCCRRSTVQKVQIGPCQTGQKGREWHLGRNLGITFEEDGNISIFESSMETFEATTIAYDEDGRVLFYSNGFRIWNGEEEIMTNGNFLAGNATQSAAQILTVRHPGNKNLWYLFHGDGSAPGDTDINYKMYYSIIDMSLDGGLGAVADRDILLFEPTTEKVTAVRHCNGKDWWVIMHELGTANFRVYAIDENGLSPTPLIQAVGSINPYYRSSSQGKIKLNNEGNILAVTRGGTFGINSNDAHFELFKFDKSTGIISDPLLIFDSLIASYGIAFSNSSEKVYFTSNSPGIVYQLDIREWDADVIRASRYEENFTNDVGAMAMGPDSIIYISSIFYFFGIVLNPEEDGADAQIIERHIELPYSTRLGAVNLPNDIHQTPKPQIIGEREVCDTSLVTYTIKRETCDVGTYEWIIPEDVEYFRVNGDTLEVVFGQSGEWSIIAEQETGCRTWYDTLQVDVERCSPCDITYEIADLDTIICEGMLSSFRIYSDADEMILRDVDDGTERPIESGWVELGTVDQDKCFEIQLIREEVCDTIIQFCITVNPPLMLEWQVADTLVCRDDIVALDFSTSAESVYILDSSFEVIYDQPTLPLEAELLNANECYYIQLLSVEDGCKTVVPFCVHQVEDITFEWISADTIRCVGDGTILEFTTNANDIKLYDQSGTDQTDQIDQNQIPSLSDGCYGLVLQAGGCTDTIGFCVSTRDEASIEVEGSETICPGLTEAYSYTTNADEVYLLSMGDTIPIQSGVFDVGPIYGDTCLVLELSLEGCKNEVTHCIGIDDSAPISYERVNVCEGDSIQVGGEWLTVGMTVHNHIDIEDGCDSTHVITVDAYEAINYSIDVADSCPEGETGSIAIEGGAIDIISLDGSIQSASTMENLAPGRYTIEINDINGCKYIEEVEVQSQDIEWPTIQVESTSCEASTGEIRIEDRAGFIWYVDGEEITDSEVSSLSSGTYEIRIISQEGCEHIEVVNIESPEAVELSLPEVISVAMGETILLIPELSTEGIVSYEWSPPTWLSCTNCKETEATPESDIEYTLVVENEDGCEGRASVRIVIEEDVKIYIPNGFSPNGDGLNDTFHPYFGEEGYNLSEMKIYDRWGNVMHLCQGAECAWDGRSRGKDLMPGMYIYEIRVEVEGGEELFMVGEVVLVR